MLSLKTPLSLTHIQFKRHEFKQLMSRTVHYCVTVTLSQVRQSSSTQQKFLISCALFSLPSHSAVLPKV